MYDVTTVFLLLITVIVTQHYPCTALLWSLRRDVTDVILCLNKGPIVRQKANQMDIMSQASQLVKYNGLIARFFLNILKQTLVRIRFRKLNQFALSIQYNESKTQAAVTFSKITCQR